MRAGKVTRREFAKSLAGTGVLSGLTSASAAKQSGKKASERAGEANSQAADTGAKPTSIPATKTIWGYLVHLSFNMWEDREAPGAEWRAYKPDLRFDMKLWDELLQKMAATGLNLVLLDLGDGVKYESHPELAVRNAWSVEHLRQELAKTRQMGLESIPKLNFSTAHDAWLGPYARCISTDTYYRVCSDLLGEVIRLFDKPRFFQIGMDEETTEQQRNYNLLVVRQDDLWCHDFGFLVKEVEKGGSRAWIWSDYVWNHPELFYERMPKSVLQSNWYYDTKFDEKIEYVKPYLELEAHGYDQVPTASNHSSPENFALTVAYCRKHIAPERLWGFVQTPWRPTVPEFRERLIQAAEQVGQVITEQSAIKQKAS